MYGAANSMLHGDGSGNMYDPEAGAAEMGANPEHVPTAMAVVLVVAATFLFASKKAGFTASGTVKAGG